MTQYFFIDESGDAGLEGHASSSSHFVITMVQLPERASLQPLVNLRKALRLPAGFEFKYHTTTPYQKDHFFKDILTIPFHARAAVIDKAAVGWMFKGFTPQKLTMELIVRLTLRSSALDISNDVLIIDGATRGFCRDLRIQFSEEYKRARRTRPFKNIIGANSKHEDGLQLADMVAGAIRLHILELSSKYFYMISPRIVDLWKLC